MNKLVLITCIILISSQLFANKKDFKPGYIILESGDTIQGSVKNQAWRINPKKLVFTSDKFLSDTLEYTVSQLKGFYSNDFLFVRKKVSIDQSINDVNDFGRFEEESTAKEDTVFLEVLARGEANLYYLREADGRNHYYVETKAYPLAELLNTMFTKTISTGTGKSTNFVGHAEEYKNQLLLALIGCKSITYEEINIDFKESALLKLFSSYNACFNSSTELPYSKNLEKKIIAPYIGAGVAFASTKFKSGAEYYNYLINADFTKSINFTATFGISYIFPKYNKQFSLLAELAYNSYHFESQVDQKIGLTTYSLLIDYSQIGVNLGVSYNLTKKQTSPYLRAGIATLFTFDYTTEATSEQFNNSYDFWPDPRKFQMGLNFGAGINFANLAVEYQLLLATGFSSNADLKNTPITNSILLKYTFNKKSK